MGRVVPEVTKKEARALAARIWRTQEQLGLTRPTLTPRIFFGRLPVKRRPRPRSRPS